MTELTSPRGGAHRDFTIKKQQTDAMRNWWRQLNGAKKQPSSNDWVVRDAKKIAKNVIEKTDPPYSDNSRKSMYSSLCKIILILNKNDLTNKDYLHYSKLSTELAKKDEKSRENQTLTDDQKKKWISYDALKSLVMGFHNKIGDGSESDMYNGLIASLYFFHPPVRVDYSSVLIWKSRRAIPKNNKNYLVKVGDKYVVHLRSYKMAWKKGDALIEFNESLTQAIDDTLELLPRKYLLSSVNDPNKPLGDSGLQKKITDIFGFGVSTLRKIYGSHWFKKWGGNKKKLTVLAEQMLHDPKTFFDHYLKFVEGDVGYFPEGDGEQPESSRMAQERGAGTTRTVATQTGSTSRTIETQTDKERLLGDRPFSPCLYSKVYKEKNAEKVKEGSKKYYEAHTEEYLRAKIIRNLNRGMTTKPNQKSIDRYNLVKGADGKWV